jgi:hypothetical protein
MLRELQAEIADKIRSHPELNGISILTADKGDIATEVDLAIAKLGLVIIVEPLPGKVSYHAPDRGAMDLEFAISILENVTLNRSGWAEGTAGTGLTADGALELLLELFNPLQASGSPIHPDRFTLAENGAGIQARQLIGRVSAGWQIK